MGGGVRTKGANITSMRSLLVCDGETLPVILFATNTCRTFGATKLTYCLVVYAVQLFSS